MLSYNLLAGIVFEDVPQSNGGGLFTSFLLSLPTVTSHDPLDVIGFLPKTLTLRSKAGGDENVRNEMRDPIFCNHALRILMRFL